MAKDCEKETSAALFDYDVAHEQIIYRITNLGVNMRKAMEAGSMVASDLWGERT